MQSTPGGTSYANAAIMPGASTTMESYVSHGAHPYRSAEDRLLNPISCSSTTENSLQVSDALVGGTKSDAQRSYILTANYRRLSPLSGSRETEHPFSASSNNLDNWQLLNKLGPNDAPT